jgi:hypothetical protein
MSFRPHLRVSLWRQHHQEFWEFLWGGAIYIYSENGRIGVIPFNLTPRRVLRIERLPILPRCFGTPIDGGGRVCYRKGSSPCFFEDRLGLPLAVEG